jgi:dienelactone hydrolase
MGNITEKEAIMRCAMAILIGMVLGQTTLAEVAEQPLNYSAGGAELASVIYRDASAEEARPGVLVFGEWWGLNDFVKARARQLAEQGYVTMAVDLYGQGRSTRQPRIAQRMSSDLRDDLNAWMGRSEAALNLLKRHEATGDQPVAAIGFSFGGSTVLKMAYFNMDLAGVAAFYSSLPKPAQSQYESIKAKLLILHGQADPYVDPADVSSFKQTLGQIEGLDWTMISYGGAKHGFMNQAAGDYRMDGLAYHARAAERAWSHLRLFLQEVLPSD